MESTIKHISKNRASIGGTRYVTACGRLFVVPAHGHIDPATDLIYAPYASNQFVVTAGETCAQALARLRAEAAHIAEINHYS